MIRSDGVPFAIVTRARILFPFHFHFVCVCVRDVVSKCNDMDESADLHHLMLKKHCSKSSSHEIVVSTFCMMSGCGGVKTGYHSEVSAT